MARATKFIGDVVVTGTMTAGATVDGNNPIAKDVTLATSSKLQLRDTHAYLNSGTSGKVTVSADAATADAITLAGNVTLGGDATAADGKQIKPDGATATATGGAATLSKQCGVVTSEALVTAAAAAYTLTLSNDLIAATSIVLVSVCNGTNTRGTLQLGLVTPGAGSATVEVRNVHSSQALNGTLTISFLVLNPA